MDKNYSKYKLTDIFNVEYLNRLCENLTLLNGTSARIQDLEGNIHVSTGCQKICSQFHRTNKETKKRCIDNDAVFAAQPLIDRKHTLYNCKNGLTEIAMPIIVDNTHIGNFFTGQFFTKEPDINFFRQQAKTYDFEEQKYLSALNKVPVFSEAQIERIIAFLALIIETIEEIGFVSLQNIEEYSTLSNKYNTTIEKLIIAREKVEENYKSLFNSIRDAIIVVDTNRDIIDCNTEFISLFGYSKDEILGKKSLPLYENETQFKELGEMLEKHYSETNPFYFTVNCKKKNGDVFPGETGVFHLKDKGGNTIGFIGLIRDISERLRAEQLIRQQNRRLETTIDKLKEAQFHLIQSEKLASIGTLTAGIAHEINNPLNFINASYYGLETYFNENIKEHTEAVAPLMNGIKTGVERAAGIVKSLNHFSRNNKSKKEIYDIHSIVDNCLAILNSQLKYKIEIHKQYTNKPFNLRGNVGEMHQTILNLITNALQSIKEKGTITISTYPEKDNIILEIADNGCGISEENISKIIDPFFTTKKQGEGTGLGLSIAYTIIKEHGGKIDFKSEINKGTSAIVTLPIKHIYYE
jgi:PAS domain S-box-containing protein